MEKVLKIMFHVQNSEKSSNRVL